LAWGQWDGSAPTTFDQCKANAEAAAVPYFAWTGQVYNGYCKVLKPSVTAPNLGTNQGYGYRLWQNNCHATILIDSEEPSSPYSYYSCGSDAWSFSCDNSADVVYAGCTRILGGTTADRAEQCYQHCISISDDFTYFAIHDSTACFCRRSEAVGPFDFQTAAEFCTSPNGHNIVFAIANTEASTGSFDISEMTMEDVVKWPGYQTIVWLLAFLGVCTIIYAILHVCTTRKDYVVIPA